MLSCIIHVLKHTLHRVNYVQHTGGYLFSSLCKYLGLRSHVSPKILRILRTVRTSLLAHEQTV